MKISTFLYTLFLFSTAGLLALCPSQLRAQAYLLPVAGTASYTTCAGTLYDDGGPDAPYDLEANGSITLRPGTGGGSIKLAFSLLEMDSVRGYLTVYNGLDTNAPLMGRFYHGLPTLYATNGAGALTIVLSSYGGLVRQGFAATISCVTSIPVADLTVHNLQLSAARVPVGDRLATTVRLTNLSGRLTGTSLRYLLSADTNVSPDDVLLGTTSAEAVAGNWGTTTLDVQVPASTAPGAYYVLCVAEGGLETNFTNNLTYAPLTVLGLTPQVDLAVTAVSYSSLTPLGAGGVFYTTSRVQNTGRTLAATSQLGYYLSADATLSTDDTLLSTALVEAPATNSFSLVYDLLSLPAALPLGTYYLLCVADYDDQIIEDNEQNNVFAQQLTILPPTVNVGFDNYRLIAPTQPSPGGSVQVQGSLQSKGTAQLDSVMVHYYLSADRVPSSDDVLLGRTSAGPLLPGGQNFYSGRINRTLAIPANTPLGRRYLLLVADPNNQLAETDETDNLVITALDIVVPMVDVTLSAFRYTSSYVPAPGALVPNRLTINNQGLTQAYPVAVGYYLSADNQLSTDDLLLSQVALAPLAGGESRVVDVYDSYNSPLIPATTAPGTYYLLAVADYLQQVAETNEANNVAAIALQVGPSNIDLQLPYNFEVLPASAAAGTSVKVAYSLGNLGTTPAYAPAVGFYLSADAQFSPDDILLGDEDWRGHFIYPSYYTASTKNVAIPRTVPPGRYYLLGVVDAPNAFAETDEGNNVRVAALEITATRPDLVLQASPYLLPKQAVAGSQVATESYINNIGAGTATASAVGYYLSTDPVLSPDDVLLGSTPASEVRPGYSAIVPGTFTLPAATTGGRYYVLFVADYLRKLDDSDRSNNTRYAILAVSALPLATREQTAGYALQVSPVPVAHSAPLRVQLGGPGTRLAATVALYNSLGQAVVTQGLTLVPGQRNQVELPTAGLVAGVYVLRLTGPSLNATRRVVVE